MNTRLHIIVLRILLTIGVTAGGLVLLSAVKTKDAKPCKKVLIHYQGTNASGFVPEREVLFVISEFIQADPVGAALEKFDLKVIELELEKNAWVYDAQLYFDNNQTLHILLKEALPVARCIDMAGNHFYLDKYAAELPLSATYRADLPVFTNLPVKRKSAKTGETIMRICLLADAIVKDTFWLAQTAQIEVLPNGKMEMYPSIGNHVVDIGYASFPEETLNRLKYFYKAMAAAGRFDDYQRINASFDRQIVAQKTGYELAKPDKYEAMNTYQKIVSDNKKTVNANSVVKESAVGRIISETVEPKAKPAKEERKAELLPKKEVQGKIPEQMPAKANEINEEKKTEIKVPKAVMPKIENN
jgi:cell division protein FtsQ